MLRIRKSLGRGAVSAPVFPRWMSTFPKEAQTVIVGGGVIGSSVAYHLGKLGRTDVVLLEQGTVRYLYPPLFIYLYILFISLIPPR